MQCCSSVPHLPRCAAVDVLPISRRGDFQPRNRINPEYTSRGEEACERVDSPDLHSGTSLAAGAIAPHPNCHTRLLRIHNGKGRTVSHLTRISQSKHRISWQQHCFVQQLSKRLQKLLASGESRNGANETTNPLLLSNSGPPPRALPPYGLEGSLRFRKPIPPLPGRYRPARRSYRSTR